MTSQIPPLQHTLNFGKRKIGKTHRAWHALIQSGQFRPRYLDPECCHNIARSSVAESSPSPPDYNILTPAGDVYSVRFEEHNDRAQCVAGCMEDETNPCIDCIKPTGPWYTKRGLCPTCFVQSLRYDD